MPARLVWFRRDLRLADNPAWADAVLAGGRVIALFVLDPRLLPAAGPFRRRQLLAELAALDDALHALGGRLHVRAGDPVAVVVAVADEHDARSVHLNADVSPYATRRDQAVAAAVRARGVEWRPHWGTLVHAPGRVRTAKGTLSQVFTPFWKAWRATPLAPWPDAGDEADGASRAGAAVVADDPGEALPRPDAAAPFPPGEAAAHERLASWLDQVDDYPDTHDRPDLDGTSALSAALRFGTVSPRHVVEVVGEATPGRAAFVRQLAWRDWYAHLTAERPDLADAPLRAEYGRVRWRDDDAGFAAWRDGRTGYPIVDAGMRQLAATGWMHNRVRMIAASFLVKDLLVDWRRGERWFRHLLVDGDVAQNAGNWQWIAGTGADAAPYFRIFNPVAQGQKFDPDGAYVRRWVPELRGLAARHVHAPWLAGPLELAAAGVTLGADYPEPIVDHAAARDRCLAAYAPATGARARPTR